jgi:hypothetical protein
MPAPRAALIDSTFVRRSDMAKDAAVTHMDSGSLTV